MYSRYRAADGSVYAIDNALEEDFAGCQDHSDCLADLSDAGSNFGTDLSRGEVSLLCTAFFH